jgi:hypothetical protein
MPEYHFEQRMQAQLHRRLVLDTASHIERQGENVRIYEDNYAYEVEQVLDPGTLVRTGWKYNIYRVRPLNEFLQSGTAETREAAEAEGRKMVESAIRKDKDQKERSKPAA